MNQYKALILGCGRIACGFDEPDSDVVLTHAHAIRRSNKIALAGLYDIDTTCASQMAHKCKTKAYHTIQNAFGEVQPDLAIIAVPDDFHEQVLEAILPFSPKIVVCEKPLGRNLDNLGVLLKRYQAKNINIAVNFNRNYDQRIIQLKHEIETGTLGEFLNGVFFYSKGIRHNGSHAISLLRYLFGEMEDFFILDSTTDYLEDDPTVDVKIRFKDGKKCYLLAGDERKYSIFEWQFLFSRTRLTFKDDGFKVCTQEITDDALFPGYKSLGAERCEESGLKNSMSMMYENVVNNLETGYPLLCPAEDAMATQSVIERILKTLHHNQAC